MKVLELVSPAGSPEKLKFALHYGADALYIGAKAFSLREGAANFTLEELAAGIDYAHSKGKKVYLAANIFFHDTHFRAFREFLHEISSIPVDGIIVSDIGAACYVLEKHPGIPVHISTQANTTNSFSASFYEKLGASRIILARELTVDEIKGIRDSVSIKLEAFVHGAMCISYSGRCLLSNYFTNRSLYRRGEKIGGMKHEKTRDANLGDCSQPCRWPYYLFEETRKNDYFPLEEGENGTAILSSRDLNLSLHLKELYEAGVEAFKIEGRMKSIYYVSNVTRVYSHCLDALGKGLKPDPGMISELDRVSHREYTTGFYFNENRALMHTDSTGYIHDYTFLGYVIKNKGKGRAIAKAMNRIRLGEVIGIIKRELPNLQLKNYRLCAGGLPVEAVQPEDEFLLEYEDDIRLDRYDILRREDT